jgi:hypothetical protein
VVEEVLVEQEERDGVLSVRQASSVQVSCSNGKKLQQQQFCPSKSMLQLL